MKIGEFAKKYNLTIDTVRHYMARELLVPDKKGGQFFFGKNEMQDIENILALKELRFSLSEIGKIISFTRFTHLRAIEDKQYFQQILAQKASSLSLEKQQIDDAIAIINDKIKQIETETDLGTIDKFHLKSGVYMDFIQYLSCPKCSHSLMLSEGKITNNMISEGHFSCSCDYALQIREGIISSFPFHDDVLADKRVNPNEASSHDFAEYIEATNTEFINHMYKSSEALIADMDTDHLFGKIILDFGTGSGVFLIQLLPFLPHDCFYVIIDKDIRRIRSLKNYLEMNAPAHRFIYICTDADDLPLMDAMADYVINYATSLDYNLKGHNILEDIMIPKLKVSGKLLACTFYVKSGSKFLSILPASALKFFEEKSLKKILHDLPLDNFSIHDFGRIHIESEHEPLLNQYDFHSIVYSGVKP